MEIKKGTKLKLKWQFLNEGEPVSLSDYSKFRLDVLDIKKVPQRTSVTLAENEVVFSIDTEKYENGRFSVRVDADGPDGGLYICHRNAFRIVPANAKSSLAKGGPGENYELTIQDDLSGQTQQGIEDKSFVVTFTMDAQENVTSNKTFAEISAKINAGEIVIGYVFRADGMKYEMLPTVKQGESGIVFSSVSYDEDNKGIVYQVECHQSEGHDFFEWSVVELAGGVSEPVEFELTDENFEFESESIDDAFLQINVIYTNTGVDVLGKNVKIVQRSGYTFLATLTYNYSEEQLFVFNTLESINKMDFIGAKLVIY